MADKSIIELQQVSALAPDSSIPVYQDGTAQRVTGGQIADFAREAADADVQRAVDAADSAEESAAAAASKAEEAAGIAVYPPKIQGGTWWVWNAASGAYVDSGTDASATLEITQVITGAPGTQASVENIGTESDVKLVITIPQGPEGEPGGVTSWNGRTGAVTPQEGDYTPQQVGAAAAVHAARHGADGDDPVNVAMSQVTGLEAALQRKSNQNLLDNWYFADPINQRGETEYTAVGYTIDRWKLPTLHTLGIDGNGIKITCSSAASANYAIQQLTERVEVGKQYTLSTLIIENTTVSGVNLRHGQVAGPVITGTGLYSYIFIANNSDLTQGIGLQFNNRTDDNGNYFVVKAIKLELGSQQTLAHQDAGGNWVLSDPPPNKALELAKCQRYQLPIAAYTMIRATRVYSEAVIFDIPLTQTLRTNPTIDTSAFQIRDLTGLANTVVGGFTYGVFRSSSFLAITATKSGHGMTDAVLYTTKSVILDANL